MSLLRRRKQPLTFLDPLILGGRGTKNKNKVGAATEKNDYDIKILVVIKKIRGTVHPLSLTVEPLSALRIRNENQSSFIQIVLPIELWHYN